MAVKKKTRKKKATKKKVTRKPRFTATQEQRDTVKACIGYGMPVEDVRLLVHNPRTNNPVSLDTLYKYFRDEIETGHAVANSNVLQTAYEIATTKSHRACATMNIFWQKTRMGFKETERHEHTDGEGGPLGPPLIINTQQK